MVLSPSQFTSQLFICFCCLMPILFVRFCTNWSPQIHHIRSQKKKKKKKIVKIQSILILTTIFANSNTFFQFQKVKKKKNRGRKNLSFIPILPPKIKPIYNSKIKKWLYINVLCCLNCKRILIAIWETKKRKWLLKLFLISYIYNPNILF